MIDYAVNARTLFPTRQGQYLTKLPFFSVKFCQDHHAARLIPTAQVAESLIKTVLFIKVTFIL